MTCSRASRASRARSAPGRCLFPLARGEPEGTGDRHHSFGHRDERLGGSALHQIRGRHRHRAGSGNRGLCRDAPERHQHRRGRSGAAAASHGGGAGRRGPASLRAATRGRRAARFRRSAVRVAGAPADADQSRFPTLPAADAAAPDAPPHGVAPDPAAERLSGAAARRSAGDQGPGQGSDDQRQRILPRSPGVEDPGRE